MVNYDAAIKESKLIFYSLQIIITECGLAVRCFLYFSLQGPRVFAGFPFCDERDAEFPAYRLEGRAYAPNGF
jgi:hypothetical protein